MTVPPDASPAEAPTQGVAAEGLDFLAPPQGPDEIGRLGSYRVLKVLGAGGMGMVLLAEDPMLKRSVALKVMRPELATRPDARQRFLREAQAAAAVEHPNIIPIHQVGVDHGVPFLVMPFLKGEPLDVRLQREKRLPVAEVIHSGREIAEGLAAAHRVGLIHRDIKPANIWLMWPEGQPETAARPRLKILDFGLARAGAGEEGRLTKTGAVLGTPAYMAPEQARGGKVDARCDLYSLGAVLYRMLTGETPLKGTDPISFIAALALDTPRPVEELNPETPPALADLVIRLLAKDPAGRPQTARAVADALASIEEDRTQVVEGAARSAAPAKTGGMRWWLLPAAGCVLLVGLLALVVVFFTRPAAPPSTGAPAINGPPPLPATTEKEIVNTVGMKLMRIEPGTFVMGSPPGEPGHKDDETQHEATISRPMYVGVYPVTVGEFRVFVQVKGYKTEAEQSGKGGTGPVGKVWKQDPAINWQNPGWKIADDQPVVCVSWNDAVAFCSWLSDKEGRRYRLPTEAEWEYACRAGTKTAYSFGGDAKALGDYAWIPDNSGGRAREVGGKKPNAWGLYDMQGDVWEWCADWYEKDAYRFGDKQDPQGRGQDPQGHGPGSDRVLRGGSWAFDDAAVACRAANRGRWDPRYGIADHGFRVVLQP